MFVIHLTLAMVMAVDTGETAHASGVVARIAVEIVIARQRKCVMEGRGIPGGGRMTLGTVLGESQTGVVRGPLVITGMTGEAILG